MKPAPPVTRMFMRICAPALGAGRWALGAGRWALGAGRWALGAVRGPSSSMGTRRRCRRGQARGLVLRVFGRRETRLRTLVGVLLLDSGALPVADDPAQQLRFVDPDHESVGGVENRWIVDELAGRPLAAVELSSDRVEVLREAAQIAGELLAESLVPEKQRDRPASLLEIFGHGGERHGRLRKVIHELIDLLLSLRVSQERRNRPRVGAHLLIDSVEDGLHGMDRAPQRLSGLPPILVVDQQLAEESMALLHLAQNAVQGGERGVQAVAETFALRPFARDRAEKALALLGAAEDVLEGPRDRAQVREQVPSSFQELLDARAPRGLDLAVDLDLGLGDASAVQIDVLVAEQADRLDRRAGAGAQSRPQSSVDVIDDLDAPVGRIRRKLDLEDVADGHAVQPDRIPGNQSRCGIEPGLIGELLAKEVRPAADHEDAAHDRDKPDQNHEPDAEPPADLLLTDHGRSLRSRGARDAGLGTRNSLF